MPTAKIALAAVAFAATLIAMPAQAARFVIEDGKAPQEVSETSRIYVDGKLVATFELDDRTPEKNTIVTTSDDMTHSYALCGEIVIRNTEGKPETHQVNSEGMLRNPDKHVFQAMGANDFTDFYLIDPQNPDAATHHPARTGACALPTS